jgi:hypothetical protein
LRCFFFFVSFLLSGKKKKNELVFCILMFLGNVYQVLKPLYTYEDHI